MLCRNVFLFTSIVELLADASCIPPGCFLFYPPNRYVFSGAEYDHASGAVHSDESSSAASSDGSSGVKRPVDDSDRSGIDESERIGLDVERVALDSPASESDHVTGEPEQRRRRSVTDV